MPGNPEGGELGPAVDVRIRYTKISPSTDLTIAACSDYFFQG